MRGRGGERRMTARTGVALRCCGVQSRGRTLEKCVRVSGMHLRSRTALGMECYLEDMRILPGSSLEHAVQWDRNEAMARETVEKQISALAPRANFARAYIAHGRTLGSGEKLDPVLESHLGSQEPAK